MTPKQIEKLQKKITDIKRRLSAEKRKFGCYDDSRGLRYLPVKYFIQLTDYKGGLTYTKWFDKNFPDDRGFPDFLFEWTIILFKTGKTKEAEKKAFQTFCSNTYLFDKYFGRQIIAIDKWEGSNLEIPDFTKHFDYSREQKELGDFTKWLDTFISTEHFINRSTKYIDIQKRLQTERDGETRHYLVKAASELEQSL
ncbi:MAG: hypothetical protein JWR61_4192 [Ferruginibacter sp.]|uniref:hypothetical protein n=1 Tax=Ferruginibacter sp. TaxID=1940288 RepID=UPI00265A3791|nr:hypothetical protein [Ferruginibacter sp.]MDB5279237.1 hypothetical protein [Ferruginibacter sp.]